jgi:dipeptide/tripeptide permease
MTEAKPALLAQIKSYPRTFWVANTMEIFERMAWYGWFTVSSVYITGSVATGGLGFTSEQRGQLQAIVPFFLYLMPVFTGALADRYGYKKMFVIAYLIMIASYYLLGQFTTFPTFLAAFMFVAVGAAIFKPVVVGTIARVTDESNSATGFGIFYMMVNIGGFFGPIVAGLVRGKGWEWVFVACAFWSFINLLIVIVFYREPTTEAFAATKRTLKKVLDDLVEVLGNLRFFITVGVFLLSLMVGNVLSILKVSWFSWGRCAIFCFVWVLANLVFDLLLPAASGRPLRLGGPRRFFLLKRMYCSNWRFALFLLIMSGFWTAFNQIFYTMPEYLRDFTETRPMIEFVEKLVGSDDVDGSGSRVAGVMATINDEEREVVVRQMQSLMEADAGGGLNDGVLEKASRDLVYSKVRLAPNDLKAIIVASASVADTAADRAIVKGRQVNPEFIVNINAGAIVLFQIIVSYFMAKYHRFTTMIVGMIIASIGIGLPAFSGGEGLIGVGSIVWIAAGGIFIFSFGEMMASPTSQEYVGRIAPTDKKALYMGYYFVAVALGNLFGGILSGQLYGKLARDMQRPDLMWLCFGGIMLGTAIVFMLYNKFALPRHAADSMTNNE